MKIQIPGFLNWQSTSVDNRYGALVGFTLGLALFFLLGICALIANDIIQNIFAIGAFISILGGIWEGVRYQTLQDKFKKSGDLGL